MAILIIPDAPRPLVALIVAMLTGSPVTAGITRHWKISLHPGVAAGTATVLVIVFGSARLTTGLIVAAIGSDGPASTSAAHPLQVTIDPLVGALVATIVFRPLK